MDRVLHPARTALLLVDTQNDYFHADGALRRNGRQITAGRSFIETLIKLCDTSRLAGVTLIGCQFTIIADTQNEPLVPAFLKLQGLNTQRGDFQVGKWGHNLIEEVKPVNYEIDKTGPSAFFRTDLHTILRHRDVDTVLIAGLNSRHSAVATAYEALSRGLRPVLVSDASVDYDLDTHTSLMRALEGVFDIRTTRQVIDALQTALAAT